MRSWTLARASNGQAGIGRLGQSGVTAAVRQIPPLVALIVAVAVVYVIRAATNAPSYIFPDLLGILVAFPANAGLILSDSSVTLGEILLGLALGTLFGAVSGIVLAWSDILERAVMPWVAFFQNVPKIVLGPLLIIWFGFGLTAKLVLVVTVVYFPVLVTTIAGLKGADPDLVDFVRSLGGSTWQVFRKVRIPSALPAFFSGLKLGATIAPIGAIVGEWLGADSGLGYRILVAQSQFHTDFLFALIIVLAFIGTVLYEGAALIERSVLKWYRLPRD